MGAWGNGLLQNDPAQDGLCVVVTDLFEAEMDRLARSRPDEAVAAGLGALVGMMLQLSHGFFIEPEDGPAARLVAALRRQEPKFDALPPRAQVLLGEVLAGRGLALAIRPWRMSQPLQRALFGDDPAWDFPMQRTHGKRERSLFRHPEAARLVQRCADRWFARVRQGFTRPPSDWEDIPLDRGEAVASLAALLFVAPCRLDRGFFTSARDR